MVLTVTLNPAIDKLLILNGFEIHKLHRLEKDEMSLTGPGGKGVNVALNLSLLGDEVIASGFAGGHAGHLLCDGLRQKGITTNFIFTGGLTRTNISVLDQSNGTLTEINDFGQEITAEDQQFLLNNYQRLLNRTDFVILAGSLPGGVTSDLYEKMILAAAAKKKKVLLHSMPGIISELTGTSPYICHPDMRSIHSLFGQHRDGIEDFIDAGHQLLEKNPDTHYVFFTHRIENVVVVSRQRIFILRPEQLNIVNMLGYNDAFIAGYIHAFLMDYQEEEVFRYASAAGLANVESIYKDLRSEEDIIKNLNRIDIEIRK